MADRYWVGGAGTWNSSSTANWSATSGGAAGASAPTTSDDVFFNASSGGTYTVQADGGRCRNITVNAGTVTFNLPFGAVEYFYSVGNISIIAATTFTTSSTNTNGIISHYPTIGGAISVSFGSSGTNTQKVTFVANASAALTTYTWCNAATQTFNGVSIGLLLATGAFTCAGSTITIDQQDRSSANQIDIFRVENQPAVSVAGTTINFGSATPTGDNPRCSFTFSTKAAAEPATTTLNVIAIRTNYFETTITPTWYSTSGGAPFRAGRLGNITIRGSGLGNGATATLSQIYGCAALTVIGCACNFNASDTSLAKTFTGAVLITASNFTVDDSASVTFSSTTTLTSSGGYVPSLILTPNISRTITFTGAFSATGIDTTNSAGLYWPYSSTIIFSSTFTSTFSDFQSLASGIALPTNITFTGAVSITDPNANHYVAATGTVTISNALSISSTVLADSLSQTLTFLGTTLTTSSTVTNWTFTNARPLFQFTSQTISNPVLLVNGGGLYFSGTLTISNALSSSGVSTYNVLASIGSTGTLNLNGAVTLVNCQLACKNITVEGGSGKNFAYSLSTPVPSNIINALNYSISWGNPKSASYPEICVDVLSLTNTGGTFSINGGGSAIYRTFVRPYQLSNLSSNGSLSLPAVTPTLIDVDFWRFQSNNAVSGTRLGRVGTTALTNITTATSKTVYWVGGAGAWDAAKWATVSGGAGSVINYPLPQDIVVFDANSGTGEFTYPATVRVGNIDVQNVPAGTSAVYCNAATITTNNAPAYLWVSGNINGPVSTPTGTFVLGNTSTNTYNSFGTGFITQSLIVADSSSLDTHTIRPTNITFMPYGSLQFASIGTTDIQSSITEPLYQVGNFSRGNYTINITASQIGSSSFDYAQSNGSYFSLGTNDLAINSVGSVNYGACSIYADQLYLDFNAPNTAYSVYVATLQCGTFGASGCTAIGNVNFTQGTTSTTTYQLTVCRAISLLNLNVVSKSNSGTTTLRVTHNGSVPRTISMYSLTATYSGSLTTMAISQFGGSKPTFVKLGGGSVGVTGVNVTNIDASPASTWFTTGTITTSTGWNAGAGPNSKGGFLLFQ
jgi:hypothetical protein